MSETDARAEGLDLATVEVERLLANAKLLNYMDAYKTALEEALIFLRPMAARVRKGEYPHPVSHVGDFEPNFPSHHVDCCMKGCDGDCYPYRRD